MSTTNINKESNNNNNSNSNDNNNNSGSDGDVDEKYVNIGYENWKKINEKWRSSIQENTTNYETTYKSVDGVQMTNEFLNNNGAFTKRIPLPDLVSMLVEEWEHEEN
ncbi:hypothetical protein CYY_002532 [Polysphondylium violaceum]|uniref:DUF4050 domain-containing protein n=1 Tax=Polysphondylium violaceum TaxID=133409 RepID=A0A8J4Q1I5_9MYCE|nr:hypothetical protein CYY_002532 [Polysphondylium violaceum]